MTPRDRTLYTWPAFVHNTTASGLNLSHEQVRLLYLVTSIPGKNVEAAIDLIAGSEVLLLKSDHPKTGPHSPRRERTTNNVLPFPLGV